MEDTLEVYHRPYKENFPMVCLDETNRQLIAEVAAWEQQRNESDATVDWQFNTADARVKLKKLYPVI
jgi:hypothetical protein